MKIKNQKIIADGIDVTEKFTTEHEIYLTGSWYTTTLHDGKEYDNKMVRVNGLGEFFIAHDEEMEGRTYFKDIKTFEFIK